MSEKKLIIPIPKQSNEIQTLDDIIADLSFITKGFPMAAVKAAANQQSQITPWLMQVLKKTIENPSSIKINQIDYMYAIFLLAQFREKMAFPLIIKLASLPDKIPHKLLNEVMTESLHNVIASVYGGDLSAIKVLIESPCVYEWSRVAGIAALLSLVKANALERRSVIEYFRSLFHHQSIILDKEVLSGVINACCDLYALELYDEIITACSRAMHDPESVDVQSVISLFNKKVPVKCGLLANADDRYGGDYELIDNTSDIMGEWECFKRFCEHCSEDDIKYLWDERGFYRSSNTEGSVNVTIYSGQTEHG